jgi:hypothetical protein
MAVYGKTFLMAGPKTPTRPNGTPLHSAQLGKVIDDAMGAIERENPTLKGVLPRDYARPSLDKVRLGGLMDIISNIGFNESAAKSRDVLGRVYEYFLGKFASAEWTLQSAKEICSNRRMQWAFSSPAGIDSRTSRNRLSSNQATVDRGYSLVR